MGEIPSRAPKGYEMGTLIFLLSISDLSNERENWHVIFAENLELMGVPGLVGYGRD